MSALVERIIAARDVLRARRHDFFSQEVLDTLAAAANAIEERDGIIRDLLPASLARYGHVRDKTYGEGLLQVRARAILDGEDA